MDLPAHMFDHQRQHIDWRPEGYYEQLCERYRGCDSSFDEVWHNTRYACWKIIVGWYIQMEDSIMLTKTMPTSLNGSYDLLETSDDYALVASVDGALQILEVWRDEYSFPIPRQLNFENELTGVFNHFSLVEIMLKYAPTSWIAEMYALFVISKDSSRCNVTGWVYPMNIL